MTANVILLKFLSPMDCKFSTRMIFLQPSWNLPLGQRFDYYVCGEELSGNAFFQGGNCSLSKEFVAGLWTIHLIQQNY